MKVNAELITIEEKMQSTELVEVLNKNFKELNEASRERDQALLNSFERLEKEVETLKVDVGALKFDMKRIIDHFSGKKLLTED